MRKVGVIGAGTFGMSVARCLVEIGCDVVVADRDPEKVREASDVVSRVVQIDAMDEEALKAAGLDNVDAAVVAIGDEIDASVLATMLLKDFGIELVVSKANSEVHGKVLKRCGADRVIFPEQEVGIRVAHIVEAPRVLDYIEVAAGVAMVEIEVGPGFSGKTLQELDLRKRFDVGVIAVKRTQEGLVPEDALEIAGPGTRLEAGDLMLVIGRDRQIAALQKAMGTARD